MKYQTFVITINGDHHQTNEYKRKEKKRNKNENERKIKNFVVHFNHNRKY